MKRMAACSIAAGLVGAVMAGPSVVAQSESGDPIAGETLAREVCVNCHQVDKGQHGISLEGAPAFQDLADDSAITSLALRVFLRSPHEGMPDLILSNNEIDDVVAYILGMR
jgi:mono/diheme cytochrome c family protein